MGFAPFAAFGFPGGIPLFSTMYDIAVGGPAAAGTGVGAAIGGAPASGTGWSESMINGLTSRSASVYGDVIWHVTPSVNATFGLRYTRDSKTTTWLVPAAATADPQALAVTHAIFGLNNILFGSASLLAPVVPSATKTWTDASPRLVLDHKVNPNTMVFASVSRGYQSGGYNVFAPGGAFAPEKMSNLETGFKTYFPRSKLALNASLFSYRFKNLQGITLGPGSPLPTYIITNADQKAFGLDLDGNIKVTSKVRMFGAFEYLDQTYDKKSFFDHTGAEVDLSGQPTGAPKLQLMGGVNVGWQALGGHMSMTLQASHTSKTRCNAQVVAQWGCLNNGSFKTGTARDRSDLKLGWSNTDRSMSVALLVNNLLDKRYVGTPSGQAGTSLGTPFSDISAPRSIRLELKASM
jgi:iron complex outermembrane receptor protein